MEKKETKSVPKIKETEQIINRDGEEIKFLLSDLSNESRMSYIRANQLAQETQDLEQQVNEKKFLANNYISNVLNEIENQEEDKDE
tara:strand:- start:750 stop:1007 length:258 start_codon:yes stop_codon:yes gene_type:complete